MKMMNKITVVLLLGLLMTTGVLAEIQIFDTDIVVKITEGNVELQTEDGNYNYACTGTSTNTLDLDFYRNVTCQDESLKDYFEQQGSFIKTLSLGLNDTSKYYRQYLECYASEKLCKQREDLSNSSTNTNYLAKYEEALVNYNDCKSERSSLVTQRQAAESAKSTCETDKKSAEDQKLLWAVGGIVLGAVGYMFIFDKSRKKPAESAAESQLPRSR